MEAIFGAEHAVSLPQECARAALIFFYGLLMLRLSGRRTFARWSALDMIVSIVAGSALSRAMTGSAPLGGTLAAVAVLVALHLALSHLVARSDTVSRIVEGEVVPLAESGVVDERMRRRHMISRADLAEALRRHGMDGLAALARVKALKLEPNGTINVVKAQE